MTDDNMAYRPRDTLLARRFVTLADTLVDDYDVVDLLDRLVSDCVDLLDVTAAGILLSDQRGNLQLMASSSEESRVLELFQLEDREGPCLEAVSTSSPVAVTDVTEMAGRWPRFAVAAQAAGYTSVHAFPMRLRHETIGALNLFSSGSTTISPDDQLIAQALADVATIGILQQRSLHRASLVAEQLQTALNTRIVVEQAKGVLAEYAGVGMSVAFNALRSYARGSNQKIGVVADALVRRDLPPGEVLPTTA
jgi:transcriptional regulator with GAF, ATPase, and Fis domain